MRHVETRLEGGICGPIWWPVGALCGKRLHVDLRARAARFDGPPSLRTLLLHVQMDEGGDFQNAAFTADTEIVVTFRDYARNRTVTRRRALLDMGEAFDVADLVTPDAESWDFTGEED